MNTVVRRVGSRPESWLAFVTLRGDIGRPVRVRFSESPTGHRWRCDRCGNNRDALCIHTRTAALSILGATPKPTTAKETK